MQAGVQNVSVYERAMVVLYMRNAWTPVDAYKPGGVHDRPQTAHFATALRTMVEPLVLPSSTTSTLSLSL